MHILFTLILVFKIVKTENNIESKYIDLLPEKEKENFLDNIARRILEEVQTKDYRPKSSSELSDDQLNQHTEFVNKILKEESENLRKHANYSADSKGFIAQDKKDDINDEDRYVDLTLRTDNNRAKRENNRRKLNEHSIYNENNKDHMIEKGEESDIDIQVKNFRRSNENIDINEHSETTTPFVNEVQENETKKQSEHNPEESENNTNNTKDNLNNVSNSTAEKNIDVEETRAPLNSQRDSNEHDTKTTNMETTTEVTTEFNDSKQTEITKISENVETIENTHISTSTVPPQSDGLRIARSYNDNLKSEKQQNNFFAINNDTDSKVINIDITLATKNNKVKEDELTAVTENVRAMNLTEIDTETSKIMDKIVTIVEVLTTTTSPIEYDKSNNENNEEFHKAFSRTKENTVQKVASNPNDKKINNKRLSQNTNSLANDMPFVVKNEKEKYFNEFKPQNNKNKIKEYKVFEISPETSPFVKQKSTKTSENFKTQTVMIEPKRVPVNFKSNPGFQDALTFGINTDANVEKDSNTAVEDEAVDTQKEQVYYAPVYNYAPKNAFYNPYNYFGPNIEKEEVIGKKRNVNDYDIDHYSYNDESDDIKRNERFDGEYYFLSDTPLRLRFEEKKSPNLSKGEAFKFNLKTTADNLELKNIYINSNNYLNADYYPERKVKIETRCGRSQNECETSNESTEYEYTTETQDKPISIVNKPYQDSMTVSRQILLENKHYGFIHPMPKSKSNKIKKEPEEENSRDEIAEKVRNKDLQVKSQEVRITINEKNKLRQFLPLSFIKNLNRALRTKHMKNKKKPNDKIRNIADYNYDRSENDYEFLIKEISRIYRLYKKNKEAFNSLESTEINPEKYRPIEEGEGETDYELIKKVIDMAPDKDIIHILFQLEQVNIKKVQRSKEISDDLDAYVTVLGDMTKHNSKALASYDWLRTTVEIQSAIKKLIDMVDAFKNNDNLHPLDQELLGYVIYLHTSAKDELNNGAITNELRALLLPKSKLKKRIIKESGLIHRIWIVRMNGEKSLIPKDDLKDFEKFLDDLQTALFDLHTALKFIAMVTPYKNQKWFENLMQIHFESKRKPLLEIVLHLFTSRLLGLVEETAKNGVEDDYLAYVQTHEKEVERTKEEFMFVLKLLEEIKKY